jgi:hypothetical protein
MHWYDNFVSHVWIPMKVCIKIKGKPTYINSKICRNCGVGVPIIDISGKFSCRAGLKKAPIPIAVSFCGEWPEDSL